MRSVDIPPVVTGMKALRFYVAFASDPVGTGRRLCKRLGSNVIVKPAFSSRAEGRRFLITADKIVAENALNAPAQFRSVGVALTRGPKDSAQRRLRNGVVRMNGPQQQALRIAYAPPLSKGQLNKHQSKLSRICATEIESWPRSVPFEVGSFTKRLARRAAAEILFGSNGDPSVMHIANMIGQHSEMQYSLKTFLFPIDLPGTPYHSLLKHAVDTEQTLIGWLRKQDHKDMSLVGRIASMDDIAGQSIGERKRAAQLWTLFGACFETTATSLRWTLCHLAWNADVQQKLNNELKTRGASSTYLDAVILESLRMTPPVAYQMRRLSNPHQVKGGSLKKGDHIIINAAAINRDPDTYEQPNRFHPERWLKMTPKPMQPLAFSAGPRRCLGFNFAMNVLRSCLVELCSVAVIDVPDNSKIDVKLAITQGPRRLPILLKDSDSPARRSRFKGKASLQMSEPLH